MPYIEIKEQDLTSPSGASNNTDIVYIPGFVETDRTINPNLYADKGQGEYIGIEVNKPMLFRTLAAFENACGKRGVVFNEDQRYSDLVASGNMSNSFNIDAIPFDGVMFYAGSEDPAYVMAKELLIAGLPVLYERMNADPGHADTPLTEKPDDWNSTYSNYEQEITRYVPIVSRTVPMFGLLPANGLLWKEDGNYYKIVEKDDTNYIYFAKVNSSVVNHTNEGEITATDIYVYDEDENKKYVNFIREIVTQRSEYRETFNYSDLDNTHKIATPTNIDPQSSDDKVQNVIVVKKNGDTETTLSADTNYTFTDAGVVTLTEALTADESIIVTYTFKLNPEYKQGTEYYVESNESYIKADIDESTYTVGVYYIKEDISDKFLSTFVDADDNSEGYKLKSTWLAEYSKYFMESKIYLDLAEMQNPTYEDTAKYFKKLSGKTIVDMYNALSTAYEITAYGTGLDDKGNYSIKYLTSGGYPTYEFAEGSLMRKMKELAVARGDCVALIDHTDNVLRQSNPDYPDSIIYKIREGDYMEKVAGSALVDEWSYAAMFTPWAKYIRKSIEKNADDDALNPNDYPDLINLTTIRMPASFAYLAALADSIKTYANWMAVAGVTRGIVPNLAVNGMTTVIPNGVADYMVSEKPSGQYMKVRSINPITNINPYGETIWGNRTLASNTEGVKATSFLNIRNLVSDIKKLVYTTCRRMTYEPNSEQLWVNIQAALTPTLDKMQSGYGISGYQLALNKEHERWGEKATLCFKIILYPVYPVESFFVDIVLKDDEIEISE